MARSKTHGTKTLSKGQMKQKKSSPAGVRREERGQMSLPRERIEDVWFHDRERPLSDCNPPNFRKGGS